MKKTKLDDISVLDYTTMVKLYHAETPRAAAILAGSYCESFLGKYLKFFMIKDIDEKKLFEGFGPFSTFSQRIAVAYAFKLITKKEKDDLNIIKKVRNSFAHNPKRLTFLTKEIKQLCVRLSIAQPFSNPNTGKSKKLSSRVAYLCTISSFVGSAHNKMLKKTSLKQEF